MQNIIVTGKNTRSVNKKIFLTFFSIVIICKFLNISEISDLIPYSFIYALYIVCWGTAAICTANYNFRCSFSIKIMFSLLLFYIIWGLNNINAIDKADAMGNMIRSVLLVLFITISCIWIHKFNIWEKFIRTLYYVFSIYLLVALLVHLPEIKILRTLSTFFSFDNTIRYRVNFGFIYPNIAAELAVCTIILSKMVAVKSKKKKLLKCINLILLAFVIVANNSRGSLLALLFFEALYYYLNNRGNKEVKKTWRLIVMATVIIIGYIVYLVVVRHLSLLQIFAGTNRQAALYENIQLLNNSGKWLMGIGRLTGGFFSSKNIIYGAQTGYLEVFYIEIFITTGIIGSIWMCIVIYKYIKRVVKNARRGVNGKRGKWAFCVLMYMLFISLYEVYLFSYVYGTSMCLNILLLSYLDISHTQRNMISKSEITLHMSSNEVVGAASM